MKKLSLVASVLIVVCLTAALGAIGGDSVQYMGGTLPVTEKTEGKLLTSSETLVSFQPKKGNNVEIPYTSITELEYGQKSGRRVAVAVFVSPIALFSKKRNHFLTITYNDKAGKEQTGVFELGKNIVRTTLKVLEVRSGKTIQYQDDEAKKSGMGGQ